MNKAEYARRWSTGHAKEQSYTQVIVPKDIVRLSVHEPCPYCGTARGMCRHRVAYAR